MAERQAAIRLLTVAAIGNAAWVAFMAFDALGSGGFAPLSIPPALVPAAIAAVLAWGLRRNEPWARVGAKVAAVLLAAVGAATVLWFVVVSSAMGDAVQSALFVVFATAVASAVGATMLWRGARAPGGGAP